MKSAPGDDPRQKLVDWMVDAKNPFFARAVANRYWAHFFGRGIVDPLDDMRVTNPPSQSRAARRPGQGSGRPQVQPQAPDPHHLQEPDLSAQRDRRTSSTSTTSRPTPATIRSGMSAEVLFDAVCQVTDSPATFDGLPHRQARAAAGDHAAGRVVPVVLPRRVRPAAAASAPASASASARPTWPRRCTCSTPMRCRTSWRARGRPGRPAGQGHAARRREDRGVVPLGLRPQADSQSTCKAALEHIAKNAENKKVAYENILWALINTKEFLFNQ